MNNLNQWEKQLRSWIPRPPSAGIKARLFPPPSVFWLAPPVGCMILVLAPLGRARPPPRQNAAAGAGGRTGASPVTQNRLVRPGVRVWRGVDCLFPDSRAGTDAGGFRRVVHRGLLRRHSPPPGLSVLDALCVV